MNSVLCGSATVPDGVRGVYTEGYTEVYTGMYALSLVTCGTGHLFTAVYCRLLPLLPFTDVITVY